MGAICRLYTYMCIVYLYSCMCLSQWVLVGADWPVQHVPLLSMLLLPG
jgi:hypothetical protein